MAAESVKSTVPSPSVTAAAPVVKAEAVSIVTGKPIATDNGSNAARLDAKAETMAATTGPVVAVKKWYADQAVLMKIALVSIVLYFLYKKFA